MTPADAAAVERAQRVRASAGADATPEVAAGLAADVLALAAALRKLRWATRHTREPDAVALVTPAAVVAWLEARGWQPAPSTDDAIATHHTKTYLPDPYVARMRVRREFRMPGHVVSILEQCAAFEDVSAAEVLAELLPAAGPWDDDGGSDG